MSEEMVTVKSWEEFRTSGLFWWINMILHTFGWAIVLEYSDDMKEVTRAYPARVKFRGFDEDTISSGYIRVSQFLKDNADALLEESRMP